MKKDCNKKSGVISTTKQRYCGDPIPCLNINKGESYDSIIRKLSEVICEGELPTPSKIRYEFEESPSCKTEGFDVYAVTTLVDAEEEVRTLVYTYCAPDCCENSQTYKIVHYRFDKLSLSFNDVRTITVDGSPNSAYASTISYTITPQDGSGWYELMCKSVRGITNSTPAYSEVGFFKNNVDVGQEFRNYYHANLDPTMPQIDISNDAVLYVGMIYLNVGDEVGIWCSNTSAPFRDNYQLRITKVG